MLVAGLDEVGRGSLAGPLLVTAAMFNIDDEWIPEQATPIPGVRDSKKFTSRDKRTEVAARIRASTLLVGESSAWISAAEINERGMGWALRTAFLLAAGGLNPVPDLLLVDGTVAVKGWAGNQRCTPKADGLWWPVSAASVLAKVARDEFMIALDSEHPGYGFSTNVGYGTTQHTEALRQMGPTPHHRTDFIRTVMASVGRQLPDELGI